MPLQARRTSGRWEKQLNQAFAGRGGGKAALVQGSVQGTREAIESFVLHTAI